ncbi:glycosyltransferase family 2 protein [Pedobacter polaris]|nr:glycosyltransferase family 2 protein [Pedobacter polaris]
MDLNTLLPNLKEYRNSFIKDGLHYPLQKVIYDREGLLSNLPKSTRKGWPWDMETDPKIYAAKESWPKITIVTPTYNQGQFIEETIRAVLLQNYPNLEYIVIDGGSTDNTIEILDRYSPWISFYESKKDKGQGHAINKGFSLASGEIYAWINSDDFYMDQAFYTLASAFVKSKADVLYGDSLVIDENKNELHYEKANYVTPKYLFVGGIIMQHSCFWKAGVHEPILEELHCAVDSELWFRLIPGKKLKHVKFPLAVVRIQPDAKTQNDKFIEKWKEDNILIAQLHQFEKTIPFFKYIQSRFYHVEVRYVQRIYKYFNSVNVQQYLEKIKNDLTLIYK